MRKGFTLIELLIVGVVSAITLLVIFSFFSFSYKKITSQDIMVRVYNQIIDAIEVINSDLLKAGYGIENPPNGCPTGNQNDTCPVDWISGVLVIKYVNYEKNNCDNATFKQNDNCSYEIRYYLNKENKLERRVIKGAVGNGSAAPLFDENLVELENFTAPANDTFHRVDYTIKGKIRLGVKSQNFTVSDSIICRNWKF